MHLIFSTKHRQPLITDELQPRLFAYFGGILRNTKGTLLAAGGAADHVHLFVSLSRQVTIANTLRDLKSNSSGWIHTTCPDLNHFAWQAGYGAFSVSHSGLNAVKDYLAREKEHHQTRSFQDEFVGFLERHNMEYDDRYIWD